MGWEKNMEDKMIGEVLVSESNPCIIASLSDIETAKKAEKYADVIEIRCDVIASREHDIEKEVKEIREKTNSPILATIRRANEGGEWYKFMGNEQDRLNIFRKLYNYINAVDIEENSDIRDIVLEEAKVNRLTTILSYHNFMETEKKSDIEKKIESMYDVGADIMKVAYYANSFEDTENLFDILLESRKKYGKNNPVSIIAMGGEGTYTRMIFPLFGSSITYGYMKDRDKPYAPGQISIQFLRKIFDKYSKNLPLNEDNFGKILIELNKDTDKFLSLS